MNMTEDIRQNVLDFELSTITEAELIEKLPFLTKDASSSIKSIAQEVISSKNSEDVETILTLISIVENNNEFTELLHHLFVESWHASYEEIIHSLQRRKSPSSIPIIKEVMQQKFQALEASGTGTGQFINQCGHALRSIGTEEAISVIRELSETSEDPVIQTEMKYRLYKMFPNESSSHETPTKRWWDF